MSNTSGRSEVVEPFDLASIQRDIEPSEELQALCRQPSRFIESPTGYQGAENAAKHFGNSIRKGGYPIEFIRGIASKYPLLDLGCGKRGSLGMEEIADHFHVPHLIGIDKFLLPYLTGVDAEFDRELLPEELRVLLDENYQGFCDVWMRAVENQEPDGIFLRNASYKIVRETRQRALGATHYMQSDALRFLHSLQDESVNIANSLFVDADGVVSREYEEALVREIARVVPRGGFFFNMSGIPLNKLARNIESFMRRRAEDDELPFLYVPMLQSGSEYACKLLESGDYPEYFRFAEELGKAGFYGFRETINIFGGEACQESKDEAQRIIGLKDRYSYEPFSGTPSLFIKV